jgi:quinoprotein dehydrogenase-associated probable ABC transporter substrate-binding protein
MCLRSPSVALAVVLLAFVEPPFQGGSRTAGSTQSADRPQTLVAGLSSADASVAASAASARRDRVLRVCADPNNLPFSNQREEGFENRLAQIIADELHATVRYTWWAERRGFVRETIGAGSCDVLGGVPTAFDRVLVTKPYYRSSYVFVSRASRHLRLRSFDDPALRTLRVGVQLIGDDGQNTPPAHALAVRHIIDNVVGFSIYGDYRQPNPPARIVDAVASGDVDVAIVWGPLAGYFARHQPAPLALAPVAPVADPTTPVAFDISIGVSRRAPKLRDEIDAVLERRRADVNRLLDEYGIPRMPS